MGGVTRLPSWVVLLLYYSVDAAVDEGLRERAAGYRVQWTMLYGLWELAIDSH